MQIEMSILWNGGFDKYLVDTEDRIVDTKDNGDPIIVLGPNSGYPMYVRTKFNSKMNECFPMMALRILKHIDGGN